MHRFWNNRLPTIPLRQVILAGLAAVLAVLALFATERKSRPLSEENDWFLPQLRADTSALDTVVLWSSKGKLTLEKRNNQWILPQKNDYPADLRAVIDFILPLREMKTLEKKTAQPALLPQLGLDEQQGTHIILMAEDELLGDIVVGKASRHGQGGFVRRAGETQAYLVNKTLFVPISPLSWLNRKLLELPAQAVLAMRVTGPDQTAETRRLDGGNPAPDTQPSAAEDSPEKSVGNKSPAPWAAAVRKALNPLLFEDVKARPDGPLQPQYTTDVQTADGLIYHFDHFYDGLHWWTALRVQTVTAQADTDRQALTQKRRKQLEALNNLWRPWLYRLPGASLRAITLGRIPAESAAAQ